MLVPKLDYLQYIAVKGVFTYLAGKLSQGLQRLRRQTSSAKQAGRNSLHSAGITPPSSSSASDSQDESGLH